MQRLGFCVSLVQGFDSEYKVLQRDMFSFPTIINGYKQNFVITAKPSSGVDPGNIFSDTLDSGPKYRNYSNVFVLLVDLQIG